MTISECEKNLNSIAFHRMKKCRKSFVFVRIVGVEGKKVSVQPLSGRHRRIEVVEPESLKLSKSINHEFNSVRKGK